VIVRVPLAFIALMSVAFLPGALDMWELPKVIMVALACLFAVLASPAGRVPTWMWMLIALASAVLVVAAISGAAPVSQLMGRWPRYEGAVTIPAYVGACWCGARVLGPGASRETREFGVRLFAFSSIAVGLIAILENVGHPALSAVDDRSGSLTGNASAQGVVGVMFAGLLIVSMARARFRLRSVHAWSVSLGFGCAVVTVVLSGSRGALAALFIVGCIFAVFIIVSRPAKRRNATVVVCAFIALSAAIGAVPATRDRLLGVSPMAIDTVRDRLSIWREATNLLVAHPVLGVGPSGYSDAIVTEHTPTWFGQVGSNTVIDSPHDWLLQAAVAGGISLLVISLSIVILVVVSGCRSVRAADSAGNESDILCGSLLALAGGTIALLVHFTSPSSTLFAAFLVGIVVSRPAPRSYVTTTTRRLWRVSVFAVWVACLAVTAFAEVPLESGTRQAQGGDLAEAQCSFELAQSLRPWDVDTTLLAAEAFASAADRGVPNAAHPATTWARAALGSAPSSVQAAEALAVGLQYSGDFSASAETLNRLSLEDPNDPDLEHRLGGVLILESDYAGAKAALERASALAPNDLNTWITLNYLYKLESDQAGISRTNIEIDRLSR
jgi:O-antigen ligase